MEFFKKDNIYKITWITGSQYNILSANFDDKNRSDNNIEVIELDFPNIDKSRIRTSQEKVSFGTNYKLSRIYSLSFNSGANSVYNLLICKLIKHYYSKNKFKRI